MIDTKVYLFARVPQSALEILATAGLSGSEYAIIMLLMRQTFGWTNGENKEPKLEDKISISQITAGTGLNRRTVIRAMQRLQDKEIINKKCGKISTWKWNKRMFVSPPGSGQMTTGGVVKRPPEGWSNDHGGGGQTTTKSSGQTTTHNKHKDNYTIDTSIESGKNAKTNYKEWFDELLNHWRNTHPKREGRKGFSHTNIISSLAYTAIRNLFEAGYTPKQLKECITNFQDDLNKNGEATKWVTNPMGLKGFFGSDVWSQFLDENYHKKGGKDAKPPKELE